MYPRSESNRDRQNRNLKFYPLNYRGIPGKGIAKITIFADLQAIFPDFSSDRQAPAWYLAYSREAGTPSKVMRTGRIRPVSSK